MKPARVMSMSSPSSSITLALLFTTAMHYFYRRESELCSEILCWACLPAIFKIDNFDTDNISIKVIRLETQRGRPWSLWVTAGCLAIISFCRSETDSFGLLPLLTPLIILLQRGWKLKTSGQDVSDVPSIAYLTTDIRVASLVAVFSIRTLWDWSLIGFVFSSVAASASFIVYAAFMGSIKHNALLPTLPPFPTCVASLAWRVTAILIVMLSLRATIFGFPRSSALSVLLLGVMKVLCWRFVAQNARHSSWNLATMLTTFSLLSTRDPSAFVSEPQALSHVVASLLSLGQIWGYVPSWVAPRWPFYLFVFLPLAPYLFNTLAIYRAQLAAPDFDQSMPHPVQALFSRSRDQLHQLLSKQSSSLEAARDGYRRRYRTDPPLGFEEWYDMAASSDSPLIDDFDSIQRTISPFCGFSGSQVLDTILRAQAVPGIDLWLCKFSGATSRTECSHPHRIFDRHISRLFNNLLINIRNLPDIYFLVNHIDEPRLFFKSPPDRGSSQGQDIIVENYSHKSVWNLLTEKCDFRKQAARNSDIINTFGLPFVTNIGSAQDLCQHPEYNTSHGLIMSPVSFRPIRLGVPILSTGALSTMGDILFPSPAYTEDEFLYDESKDVEWDKKKTNLYWAGSTTGGFALGTDWHFFHRQRLVELGQNLNKTNYYLRKRNGVIKAVKSSFLNGRLFNIAFTRIFQCQRGACRDQNNYFKTKSWADKDEVLRSKLAFDLDGNGISGRYYKLLASRSVPLKQTLFQEWHDDRLVPWLHYVPVSQSMAELPELVFYLTSTPAGRQIARQIADHGREWYTKAFREVDLRLYTYRLLLEMARLQDPQRQAGVTCK